METVRLRLVFDSSLTKCQKIEGLKRCWILLKPEHQTISDISSYILSIFDLHKACPNGILLSMEGFVLPPFESTSIFKDKDIIRVKRMGGGSTDMILVDDGVKSLEVVELVNTQPVPDTGMNLLANEEFDKESGEYKSDSVDDDSVPEKEEENVESSPEPERVSKKRKASGELHSSKKKKNKSATAEKCAIVPERVGNDIHTGQNETLTTPKVVERKKKGVKAMPQAKRSSQPQENGNGNADASHSPDESKKPSRSARRKKLKRQWLKEQRKAEQKEQHQRQLIEKISLQSSGKDVQRVSENGGQKDCEENNKCEEDHQSQSEDNSQDVVVPIKIKPGHIRFGSSRKVAVDQAKQQDQIPVNPFQWSGVTSKRKGQKWGTEKGAPDKRKRHDKFSQEYPEMLAAEKQAHDERNNYNNFNQESPNMVAADEDTPENGQVNYDELPLHASLPKEGDVIAYRVIELSSSWTPEPSSYRVGRVSWYDPQSNRIIIVPVPGYPVRERDNDECPGVQETSLYGEDGSLEADYSSLLEVRSIKHGCLKSGKSVSKEVKQVLVQDQDAGTCLKTTSNKEAPTSVQEKREVNGWGEIQQALSAKKAKLSEEDSGSKAESSGRNPWSFKAMRSSALGPTMALLRAQDRL